MSQQRHLTESTSRSIVDEQLARHRRKVLNMGLGTQRGSRLALAVREAHESMTAGEIRECVERNLATPDAQGDA